MLTVITGTNEQNKAFFMIFAKNEFMKANQTTWLTKIII